MVCSIPQFIENILIAALNCQPAQYLKHLTFKDEPFCLESVT